MRTVLPKTITGLFLVGMMFGSSCSSPRQFAATPSERSKNSSDPQFLEDITLNNNSSSFKIKNTPPAKNLTKSGEEFLHELQLKYASLLNVTPQMLTNFSLYHFIEDWYGVKYRFGGNDKEGIDCSAFAQRLYEQVFCLDLYRSAREQFKDCELITASDSLSEGDLVFFKRGKRISHVGVYLHNNYFVHASTSQGVVISNLNDTYWSRYYVGAGRVGRKTYEITARQSVQ